MMASINDLTLARKLEEARITAQEEQGVLQVGSHASPPATQVGSSGLARAIMAGIVGAVLGALIAFALEFLRSGRTVDSGHTEEQSP